MAGPLRTPWYWQDEREWSEAASSSCAASTSWPSPTHSLRTRENKVQHKVSWRHPRSKHWHQLDLILTRRKDLNTIRSTRSLHSTECDTEHALVHTKIKLTPRKLHHSKPKGCSHINTSRISDILKTCELLSACRASLAGLESIQFRIGIELELNQNEWNWNWN